MRTNRMILVASLLGVALYLGCSEDGATADAIQNPQSPSNLAAGHAGQHQDVTANLQWGPAPPGFPAGAQFAVLQGDPSVAGQVYTVRLRMPSGYTLAPHFHPTDEAVTVVRGTFLVGLGDSITDAGWLPPLSQGAFIVAPADAHHFARAHGATEVQVHGMGPFTITYVNPEDDPRGK